MKALCWHGKHDIRYETVPDPVIEHPRDAIERKATPHLALAPRHGGVGGRRAPA